MQQNKKNGDEMTRRRTALYYLIKQGAPMSRREYLLWCAQYYPEKLKNAKKWKRV